MCNCNNPETKVTHSGPLCDKVKGQEKHDIFIGIDPIKQHMVGESYQIYWHPMGFPCESHTMSANIYVLRQCLASSRETPRAVFTNAACKDVYGDGFNAFCAAYIGTQSDLKSTPIPPMGGGQGLCIVYFIPICPRFLQDW